MKIADKKYRLLSVVVSNFMGVKLAEVEFDGKSVQNITGDNGAGKTSFLRAIETLFGGADRKLEAPIRNGEDRAEIIGRTQDFVITRKFERGEDGKIATKVAVTSLDGMEYGSPMALLGDLIGKLAFDPLEFTRQDAKKQVETLKTLVGLDFTDLNISRKTHFDNRTVVNRDVTGLRSNVEKMHFVEAPDEPVSVAALLQQQKSVIEEQRQYDALQRTADEAKATHARADARVLAASAGVEAAQAALLKAQKALEDARTAAMAADEAEQEARGEADVAMKPALDAIRKQIEDAESINELVRQKRVRAEASRKLREKELEAESLTEQIDAIDKEKRDALAAAQFPVPGLSFIEDDKTSGVTLDGVPFAQVNQAAKIRVSMAIGLKLNPKLPLILIRDASLLGEQQLGIVAEMAEEAGAQVLLERVYRPGEVGIHLEDGLIVAGEKAA